MTYKDMIGLRDARIKQYEEEKKAMDAETQQMARQNIRNTIMTP